MSDTTNEPVVVNDEPTMTVRDLREKLYNEYGANELSYFKMTRIRHWLGDNFPYDDQAPDISKLLAQPEPVIASRYVDDYEGSDVALSKADCDTQIWLEPDLDDEGKLMLVFYDPAQQSYATINIDMMLAECRLLRDQMLARQEQKEEQAPTA